LRKERADADRGDGRTDAAPALRRGQDDQGKTIKEIARGPRAR
jgi:hypothetical protein